MNNDKKDIPCQAFGCFKEVAADDDMNLFCADHWAEITEAVRALLKNAYDPDVKSAKHLDWQREVRKVIAVLMAREKGLKRNVAKKNLDEFDRPDPFVKDGEQRAASKGKVLGTQESDPGIVSNNGAEGEDDT